MFENFVFKKFIFENFVFKKFMFEIFYIHFYKEKIYGGHRASRGLKILKGNALKITRPSKPMNSISTTSNFIRETFRRCACLCLSVFIQKTLNIYFTKDTNNINSIQSNIVWKFYLNISFVYIFTWCVLVWNSVHVHIMPSRFIL